jgi:hypothetical protein
MAEHAGGDAGLLDLGIAVHDAADPAQVDVERTGRPPITTPAAAPLSAIKILVRILQAHGPRHERAGPFDGSVLKIQHTTG